MAQTRGKSLATKFCGCVKKVRRTVRVRRNGNRESAAIGICTGSVLQTRGKTLRKFSCKKGAKLQTQTWKH
ncbi:hypothetical protein EBR66_05940 [bacterium]|nr:hypothetical protein [bacterium]